VLSTGKGRVLVSALVVAGAASLPWAQPVGVSVSGIHGDGRITFALGVIGAALALYARGARYARRAQIVLALVCCWISAYHIGGVAGGGVYVTFAASISWLVFAWRGTPATNTS
jgi:hypothetical protein